MRRKCGPQLPGKFLVSYGCLGQFLILTSLGFCDLIDRETLLNEIMTSIEDLVSDTSQHVRAALGTQISGLAPILGKEEYESLAMLQIIFC